MDGADAAAEYVLDAGNPASCSASAASARSRRHPLHAHLAAVPLLQERTHLPVIVDPSHGAGTRGLVARMARRRGRRRRRRPDRRGRPDPEAALSDGYQSMTFTQFEEMMQLCRKVAAAVGRVM